MHAATLVGALVIVDHQVVVEHALHLLDGLEPGAPALDTEVLVQERAVQALDDAVGLWPLDLGGAVLDRLELQEQLVGWRSGRPQNSRPLSDSTTSILASAFSKVGMTKPFIRWTAVTGSLLE